MSNILPGQSPLAYQGVPAANPPNVWRRERNPTTDDWRNYTIGDEWWNKLTFEFFKLVNREGPVATWNQFAGPTTGAIETINGIDPDGMGNFAINPTANQIAVTGGTNSITLSLIGPFAPSSFTAHTVLLGEGTSSIGTAGPGTDGLTLIGNTGVDPSFAAIGTKSGLTAHGIVLSQNTGAFTALSPSALSSSNNGQFVLVSTGLSTNPAYSTTFSVNDSTPLAQIIGTVNNGLVQLICSNSANTSTGAARMIIDSIGTGDCYIFLNQAGGNTIDFELGAKGSTNTFEIQINPANSSPNMDGTAAFVLNAGVAGMGTAGLITLPLATSASSGGLAFGTGGPTITSGTGPPSSTQPQGSLFLATNGSGVNNRAYINTDGMTTWTAIVTVA